MKNKQKQPCLRCLSALPVMSHLPFPLPGVQPPREPPWDGLRVRVVQPVVRCAWWSSGPVSTPTALNKGVTVPAPEVL